MSTSYTYPNGDKYIGEINNKKKEGKGELICANGDR